MNGTELADRIAAEHMLGKAEAKRMIETVFATITHAAAAGEEVAISGFGKFKVTERPARPGRNPATGEAIEIAASRKLAFVPAKQLGDGLNGPGETTSGGGKAARTKTKARARA